MPASSGGAARASTRRPLLRSRAVKCAISQISSLGWDFARDVNHYAAIGARAISVVHGKLRDHGVEAGRKLLAASGLEVAAYASLGPFPLHERARWDAELETCRREIGIAAELGAPLVIFAFLRRSASGLVLLTPLYDRLTQLGATVQEEQTYDGLRVPVVTADYLCAIALQTGRPKDYQRVHSLFEADCITPETIRQLIQAYDLQKRWEEYVHRYA